MSARAQVVGSGCQARKWQVSVRTTPSVWLRVGLAGR